MNEWMYDIPSYMCDLGLQTYSSNVHITLIIMLCQLINYAFPMRSVYGFGKKQWLWLYTVIKSMHIGCIVLAG